MKKSFIAILITGALLLTSQPLYAQSNLEQDSAPNYGVAKNTQNAKIETINFDDGSKYVGTLKKNKMHGKGTYYFADGTVYTGDVFNGYFSGKGKMVFPYGDRYEGQFKADLFDGMGKYVYADGTTYEGQFKKGDFEGTGKQTFMDGDVYEGQFKQGLFHGTGKLKLGLNTYSGNFKDGNTHGSGKTFSKLGYTLEANYIENELNGAITLSIGKDIKIQGKISEELLTGKTTVFYKGKKHIIDFTDETIIKVGDDLLIYDSLMVYQGQVKDNLPSGKGVLHSVGIKYTGTFDEGKFVEMKVEYSDGTTLMGNYDEEGSLINGTYKNIKGESIKVDFLEGHYKFVGKITINGKLCQISYEKIGENIQSIRIDNMNYDVESVTENGVSKIVLTSTDGNIIKILESSILTF